VRNELWLIKQPQNTSTKSPVTLHFVAKKTRIFVNNEHHIDFVSTKTQVNIMVSDQAVLLIVNCIFSCGGRCDGYCPGS